MLIEDFIKALRESDEYIKHIYLEGSCFRFHQLLATLFEDAEPYLSAEEDHIITKWNGRFWDITGEILDPTDFMPLPESKIAMVEGWSFRRNNLIQLHQCPHCEEPFTYSI